jgi:hypothetical protein
MQMLETTLMQMQMLETTLMQMQMLESTQLTLTKRRPAQTEEDT